MTADFSVVRSEQLADSHGRVLRDLRVSVTGRCNFRCLYCLPETEEAADFYQNRFGQAARFLRPHYPSMAASHPNPDDELHWRVMDTGRSIKS